MCVRLSIVFSVCGLTIRATSGEWKNKAGQKKPQATPAATPTPSPTPYHISTAVAESKAPSTELCRYYLSGFCWNGKKCRYQHLRPEPTPAVSQLPPRYEPTRFDPQPY